MREANPKWDMSWEKRFILLRQRRRCRRTRGLNSYSQDTSALWGWRLEMEKQRDLIHHTHESNDSLMKPRHQG